MLLNKAPSGCFLEGFIYGYRIHSQDIDLRTGCQFLRATNVDTAKGAKKAPPCCYYLFNFS